MLESLRQAAGGTVAKILIGLLIISFGVWGVSGSLFTGNTSHVVTVGETKVGLLDFRLAYDNQLNRLSQQLQTRLSREQANAFGLEQNVIAQLVSGAVLDESARKMGLGLSSSNLAELIGDDPAFQDASGNFSRSRLDYVLRQVGMREQDFVQNRKAVAVRNQITDATAGSIELPKTFLKAYHSYENQQRAFRYAVIGPAAVTEKPEPSDTDISAYYEANKANYMAPEYRKVQVLRLEAKDVAKPEEVTAEEVANAYEDQKAGFTKPEKRRIQQLVFENREKAEQAAAKLADGTAFDALLLELGKTSEDVDLGLLAKSDLPDNNVAEAAFGLDMNKTSEIVDGIFGPVILRVSEIEPESTKPLAEVEDQLRRELAIEIARDTLFDAHDRIEDERAAGDTIPEAGAKAGLEAVRIAAVDQAGLDPDGNPVAAVQGQTNVLAEIFATEAGAETDPVNLEDGYVWYEVEEIIPTRQKTLDEVSSQVATDWKAAEVAKRVAEIAERIKEKVDLGQPFAEVLAAELPTDSLGQMITPKETGLTERGKTLEGFSRQAVQAGFNAPSNSILVADADVAGSKVVMKVTEIEQPDSTDIPDQVAQSLNGSAADDLLTLLVEDLQSREEVYISRQAIEIALSY